MISFHIASRQIDPCHRLWLHRRRLHRHAAGLAQGRPTPLHRKFSLEPQVHPHKAIRAGLSQRKALQKFLSRLRCRRRPQRGHRSAQPGPRQPIAVMDTLTRSPASATFLWSPTPSPKMAPTTTRQTRVLRARVQRLPPVLRPSTQRGLVCRPKIRFASRDRRQPARQTLPQSRVIRPPRRIHPVSSRVPPC